MVGISGGLSCRNLKSLTFNRREIHIEIYFILSRFSRSLPPIQFTNPSIIHPTLERNEGHLQSFEDRLVSIQGKKPPQAMFFD